MWSLLSVVLLLLTVNQSHGVYWQHGNCIAYLNQTKPFVPNTANHCFIDFTTGIEYCLYSDCPKPPCRKPFHDGHICQTCPGKCQEGERFYDPGAKFLSYDGFRKCQCQRDPGFGAKMFCQVIDKPDPFNFCGIPYPFGYKKGVDVRKAQSFNNGVMNNPAAHHNSLNNGGGPLQGGVNFIGAQNPNTWPANPAPTNPVPVDFFPTAPPPIAHNTAPASWNNNNIQPAVGGANQNWQNNNGGQGPNNNNHNNNGGQQWQNNGNNGGQQWQQNNGNNGGQQQGGGQNGRGGQQWQNNNNNGQQWQNNNNNGQRNNNGGGWPSNNNRYTTMWPNFETK